MKQRFTKAIACLLTCIMLLSACIVPALAELQQAGGEQKTLGVSAADTDILYSYNDLLKDADGNFSEYHKVVCEGYYTLPMTVNVTNAAGEKIPTPFDLRMYNPENSQHCQPSIFLVVPSGVDPYQFMIDSGWKAVADTRQASIFLLMPNVVLDENGVPAAWGSWEGYDQSLFNAYLGGANGVIGQRPGIQTVNYCQYLVAYGDVADLAATYVMGNTGRFAGAFIVGATGAAADKTSAAILPFGVVSDNADVSALVNSFKALNKTVDEAAEYGSFTYYAPDPTADVGQPEQDPCAGVYVKNARVEDCLNAAFAEELFNILIKARRYPAFTNVGLRAYEDTDNSADYEYYTSLSALGRLTYGGDIQVAREDENPVYALGDALDYVRATEAGTGHYYNREWWLYVPQSARDRMDAGEKVEVVFLFHGSNGYGDEIAQRTGWDDVAADNGFILVCPTGHMRHQGNFGRFVSNGVGGHHYVTNWNWMDATTNMIPDDLLMVEDVYNWLFNESKYAGKVDPSRVYASGQSAGGAFTHYVGQQLPQLFTAVAPCSWVDNGVYANTSIDVPMIVLMGQKDTTVPEGLSTGVGAEMIDTYVARYGGLKDPKGRDSSDEFTFGLEKTGGKSDCTAVGGEKENMNLYIFQTEAGIPMFVGVDTINMAHATIPSGVELAWDTFLSHFSKDPATGVVYYDGVAVDTPVNQALLNK